MEKQVIAFIVETPDGTKLVSKSVHDYIEYTDKNGKLYCTDGGSDYCHYIVYEEPENKIKLSTIYSDSPFEEIRKYFYWGTRGKDGKSPLKFKSLNELDHDHIENILETQKQVPGWRRDIFKQELEYRQKASL